MDTWLIDLNKHELGSRTCIDSMIVGKSLIWMVPIPKAIDWVIPKPMVLMSLGKSSARSIWWIGVTPRAVAIRMAMTTTRGTQPKSLSSSLFQRKEKDQFINVDDY